MDSKAKSKVRIYIFSMAAISVFCIAFIAVISVVGLGNAAKNNEHISFELTEKSDRLYSMILSLERIKRLSGNLILYIRDMERTEYIKSELSSNMNIFFEDFNVYMTTAELSPHEMDQIKHIANLMSDYQQITLSKIEMSMIGDIEALKAIADESTPIVSEIGARLQENIDYMKNRMQAITYDSMANSHFSIYILIVVAVFAFIIIMAVSIAVISGIFRIPMHLPGEPVTAKPVQSQYGNQVRADNSVLLTDLERCISDLKAVTYDLTVSAKELKK